ncbi:hypothetical protein [Reyranella sp.]|uniref:hypothetical protein n=1 Tax=Reyranella sp. TaxID=1929291 RepID=UPI003BACC7C7
MRRWLPSVVGLGMLPALLSPASAQTRKEAEEMLLGLYIVSIAIDACDLDLTKEQENRLDYWIEWAEKKLDIADRKLDKAYAKMEDEVEKDKVAFCKEMTPVAEKALKELPAQP